MVTRSCLGVWDFMTGHLLFKLNNSALGAIITHGLVNEVSEHATIAGLCVTSYTHDFRMGHTLWLQSLGMFCIGT